MNGFTVEFARPEWVYYVLPGGLLALGLLVWLAMALGERALAAWAPGGAGRITLGTSASLAGAKLALAVGGWALLCIALARPQGGAETMKVPRGGTDLIVLVDVSNSMLVSDMSGGTATRLQAARWKIETLLDMISEDPIHRVGLIPFAGEPFPLVPPTPDYEAVRFFLEDLNPRSVALGGSDLAKAIDRAVEELKKVPGKHKAILVLSDGDFLHPSLPGGLRVAREKARKEAVGAAEDARRNGVMVFALGMGGEAASEIAVRDDDGRTRHVRYSEGGKEDLIATSRLEASTLALVAPEGSFRATPDDTDLLLLLSRGILTGGVSGEEELERSIPVERFQWPLLGAFVLLLVEMFVPAGARRERIGEAAA